MQLADVFPSNYLKAANLQGREVNVVISDAKVEKLGDERKLVIYFQGKEKGLVTNKTNAGRIAYLYGEDTDGWIGKEITLFVDMVDYQGRTVEAIRIKAPQRRAPAPAAASANQFVDRKVSGGGTIMETVRPDQVSVAGGRGPLDDEIPF